MIDIEMERSTKRGAVDPKLDAMMRWQDTDPNPAFLPRPMPHFWTPRTYAVKPEPIEVPKSVGDRLYGVLMVACNWLDGLFGFR